MTSVNITTQKNTVTVNGETSVVTISTVGPQGPAGSGSGSFDIDTTNKVDGSVVYYDSTSARFKADSTTTKSTIVDGGSF